MYDYTQSSQKYRIKSSPARSNSDEAACRSACRLLHRHESVTSVKTDTGLSNFFLQAARLPPMWVALDGNTGVFGGPGRPKRRIQQRKYPCGPYLAVVLRSNSTGF